ncbi:hypothetical protein [Paenibacillus urinalis]|uniref:hypothetical protein n=1 Tax=Paenibacillus urinalis TaxID=521520 RepID=UPI0019621E06
MNKIVVSRKVNYFQQDVAELEQASLRVQSIYEKAARMVKQYFSPAAAEKLEATVLSQRSYFQKWIHTSKGWKFIGSEYQNEQAEAHPSLADLKTDTSMGESTAVSARLGGTFASLILQAFIWSQYEEIQLFHPFLGDESFYTGEEMDVIAAYFVPTYLTERPLYESGIQYRRRDYGVTVYQEDVPAPSVVFDSEWGTMEGKLMTGVYVSGLQFKGLGPYLKNMSGKRIYMQAAVQ